MTGTESSPGALLRAEREALGVTVREVAETLNLAMSTIDAIESDDHARLPGPVFARGYVRAYARLLDLDPQPLLQHYPKAPDPLPAAAAAAESPVWEWIRRRPAIVLGGAGGLLLLLLLLILIALWPDADEPARDESAPAPASAQAAEPVPEPEPGVGAGLADRPTAAAPAAAAPVAAYQPLTEPTGAPPAQPVGPDRSTAAQISALAAGLEAPDSAATATPPALAAAGGVRRITAAGDDRLSFGFSDDCWVEIKNASGVRLYSDLSPAGAELELVGQGPFRILLGYAPGARLTYNGEPVPLAPHTRNNVATLVLGQ